jgi:hypothetical protein
MIQPTNLSSKFEVMLRPTISRSVYLGISPHLGTKTKFLLLSVVDLLMWGALSEARTGLSFKISAGSRQRSHYRRLRILKVKSQSYVTTEGQSASLSWCQAPI